MSLINKPIELLKEDDLQGLIDNQVSEGKNIEYKETFPGTSDSEKKEFLADISSFANTSGGDIIYGIKETNGKPTEIRGLEITNTNELISRIENVIRDGIAPRIAGITIKNIASRTSKPVIIARIPKSWALPHMVAFQGQSKFFARNSNGKYQLDVFELRTLFNLSETTTERIKNFRIERLSKIISEETPIALLKNPKIVLHLIPFRAFDPTIKLDLTLLTSAEYNPSPIYSSGWNHRYNLDGFLTFSISSTPAYAYSYLQLFRTGIIEAVETEMLNPNAGFRRIIPSVLFERELLNAFSNYLTLLEKLGIEPPLFVFLSLLGVSGYTMAAKEPAWAFRNQVIDRNIINLPEIIVETYNNNPEEIMKPIFDAVWNAAGWPRSMNYDDTGKWVGKG